MMRKPSPTRHVSTRDVLDYLDDRVDARARARVEEHLGGACARCRELLRDLSAVRQTMRDDRTPEVSDMLRARALSVFVPPALPARPQRTALSIARLLFDSRATPLPAAVRRAVGDARRLRFAHGEHLLDVEYEAVEAGVLTLRGHLTAPDPAVHRVEVFVKHEVFTVWPTADGDFAVHHVPPGDVQITVVGPSARFRVRRWSL